jgi:DNA-binding NtrC family response regulator
MEERKKLIYIDDEEYNLLLFKMSFKDKYDIFTSISPSEGLDIIKKEKIKVVITDYKMPGMNGLQLIDEVKNFQPDTICMLLSAYLESDIMTGKQTVFKYISKPYKQKELLQHIETAFGLNM